MPKTYTEAMDLDVNSPDKVADVLRVAAQEYYQAEGDLSASWQDPGAGYIWAKIAKILEQAASKIDKLD